MSDVPAWRSRLPVLRGNGVVLREFRSSDAPRLLSIGVGDDQARFNWPARAGLGAMEDFIHSTHQDRAAGRKLCFAIATPDDTVAGVFDVRRLQPSFFLAETGFFLSAEFRGTGMFIEAAQLLLDYAFAVVGIHRLEARVAIDNHRSNGALAKLGATKEAVLLDAFLRDGEYVNEFLWSLRRTPWLESRLSVEYRACLPLTDRVGTTR
jgi:RimJ/RimL family protein N-acetyltransferase